MRKIEKAAEKLPALPKKVAASPVETRAVLPSSPGRLSERCAACGTDPADPGATFCHACGATLPKEALLPVYSPVPYDLQLEVGGRFHTFPPGLSEHPKHVVDHVCGPDFTASGSHSRLGLRRLLKGSIEPGGRPVDEADAMIVTRAHADYDSHVEKNPTLTRPLPESPTVTEEEAAEVPAEQPEASPATEEAAGEPPVDETPKEEPPPVEPSEK